MHKVYFFITFLCVCLGASAESQYIRLVDRADKAIADGDYKQAIALLGEALRTEPDNSGNVMLLSNIGMLHYYTGNDSLAIHTLSLAHDIAPQSVTILSNRAKVLKETGHYAAAIRDYDTIIAIDSTLYAPHLHKGVIYLSAGDTEAASTELRRVETMTDATKSLECSAALAWLASMTDNRDDALKYYSALINLEPSAEFYAARAMCYVNQENYPDASTDIAEAIRLDPDCAEIYVARACLNKKMYRNDDSLSDAQKAIELGADSRRVRSLLNL
ncbi:MAG: tetratricopeptide repeat protein [Muribaculaceae bacterium]|nr:tetratricopeptide repeat protein [Muribaculaceae bacterium]